MAIQQWAKNTMSQLTLPVESAAMDTLQVSARPLQAT
jgi:hypothetical protein